MAIRISSSKVLRNDQAMQFQILFFITITPFTGVFLERGRVVVVVVVLLLMVLILLLFFAFLIFFFTQNSIYVRISSSAS